MLGNIILLLIVCILIGIVLQYRTVGNEGFVDIPVDSHIAFVKESEKKFNQLTNTINLLDPALPVNAKSASNMKEATKNSTLVPTNKSFDVNVKADHKIPDELPDALELAKKCEAAAKSCSAFDDPNFSQYCGMSFDKGGIGSDGKPHTGGLFISPTDRSAQLTRFKTVKETGSEPYDPYKVAKPTIGQAKEGTFALTKDQCIVVKEKVDCEEKQTFSSPNCTQCYTSSHFSRVGPDSDRIPIKLLFLGNGTVFIRSTRSDISMEEKTLQPDQAIEMTLPGNAEGVVLDITVKKASSPPTYFAGYLQGETGRGVFKMDLSRMVQSDKSTGVKPRISGMKAVNGYRCTAMIPGASKTTMVLSILIPFSFINMYDSDALTCDNGPVLTKASSAVFLESDPCFSKDNRPGSYKLECLQDRWVSLGGTQKGTGYPSDQAKADALQKGPNGAMYEIDIIIENVSNKMIRAVTGRDESGKPLSIPDWNEASMWGLGIPINTPCDGVTNEEGPPSRECMSYLYMNKGAFSHIGPTYTSNPRRDASMKDQTIPNTFCQPGTELDPSTDTGFAYAKSLGGIPEIKKKYDEIHRMANDDSQTNAARSDAVKKCYGTVIQPPVSNKMVGAKQVFAVGPDYRYSKGEAAAVCAKYGAEVATRKQLEEAQKNGADWCFSAWLADSPTGSWPISTTPVPGCGSRRGIIEWTPDSQKAGVNCYGPKPVPTDVTTPGEIMPFNGNAWDQPTEPTYLLLKGGYLETSGLQPACFSGLSPQQAQANCDALGGQCAGFSYSVDGGGHGCYKGDVEGGKVMNSDYVGYVKSSMTSSGEPISGRYIKLQHDRNICMNLAQIYVYSEKGGKNMITPQTAVSKSSGYGGDVFPNQNFVNGRADTFIHTSCYDVPWIQVDLGSVMPIYKIVIQNRGDCCQDRAQGITIQILNESQQLIFASQPIRTTSTVYTIFPPSAVIQPDLAEDMPKVTRDKTKPPPGFSQGVCNPGYYDRTKGGVNWWGCGVDCEGGTYWTDGVCNCACVPNSQDP
jgi:hypothetical protein